MLLIIYIRVVIRLLYKFVIIILYINTLHVHVYLVIENYTYRARGKKIHLLDIR